jgi:hypothetical protein
LAVWYIWKAVSSSIFFVRYHVSSAFQAELPIGIGINIGEKKDTKSLSVVPPKNPKSFYNGGKSRREDEIGRKVSVCEATVKRIRLLSCLLLFPVAFTQLHVNNLFFLPLCLLVW